MGKVKYYYNNMPLLEYGETIGISKSAMSARVRELKKDSKNKNLSDEEIVKKAVEEFYASKYIVYGMTLWQYCLENNLQYNTLLNRIKLLEKNPKYQGYNYEKLLKVAIDEDFMLEYSKYRYRGMLLTQYCRENNISYKLVHKRVAGLKSNPLYFGYPLEKLIDMALVMKTNRSLEYNGEKLKKYCQEHGLDYLKIIRKIEKMKNTKKFSRYSDDEIIKMALNESAISLSYKYIYNGIPLVDYCKEKGISYNSIIGIIKRLKDSGHFNQSYNDLVKFVVENDSLIVSIYNHKKIADFLNQYNIVIEEVIKKAVEIKNSAINNNKSNRDIINETIKIYNNILKCEELFENMKTVPCSFKDVELISEILHINKSNLYMVSPQYGVYKATLLIHYFGANTSNGRVLSLGEMARIEDLMKVKDFEGIDLIDLVKIHKSELADTSIKIIEFYNEKVDKVINDYVFNNNFEVDEYLKEDIFSEYKYYILKILNGDHHRSAKEIIEKLDDTTCIVEFLDKERSKRDDIILTTNELDNILVKSQSLSDSFSEKLMGLLDCLSQQEKSFIINKYQKGYTDEDLAKIYSMSKKEIANEEKKILDKLFNRGMLPKKFK